MKYTMTISSDLQLKIDRQIAQIDALVQQRIHMLTAEACASASHADESKSIFNCFILIQNRQRHTDNVIKQVFVIAGFSGNLEPFNCIGHEPG